MMIPWGEDRKPENYKDYRNRTIDKFERRAKDLHSAIKDCSLKGNDKIKIRNKILELLKH